MQIVTCRFSTITMGETFASAIEIGDSVSIDKAVHRIKKTNGVVEEATEEELMDAIAQADLTGMFYSQHTGVALATVEKLRRSRVIQVNDRKTVVSMAHGLKYVKTKVSYHERKKDMMDYRYANPHIAVKTCFGSVMDVLKRTLRRM